MKAIKAFLELFGKMVLSLAVIISIAFAIKTMPLLVC